MRHIIALLSVLLIFSACTDTATTAPTTEGKSNSGNKGTQVTGKLIPGSEKGNTPTGYPYVLHKRHEGAKPQVGDQITYHEILFLNDSLIKSSHYGFEPIKTMMPEEKLVAKPAPPSYEAIKMLSVKDSITVFQKIDSTLVKASQIPKWLSHGDELRYEITLESLTPRAEVETGIMQLKGRAVTVRDSLKMRIEMFKKGELDKEIQTTESGLKYIVHDPGEGEAIESGKFLQVHYFGALMDGTPFDDSFGKAKRFAFQVGRGRVIQGWDDGLVNVKKGGKITMFIPYKLGYGEAGKPSRDGKTPGIPERTDIAFYVEVVDVR